MGIRMSKGKAHSSLDEQMTLAKQKAKFDALSLSTKDSKSSPKQPRVTFNLENTVAIEQKEVNNSTEETKEPSTAQQDHSEIHAQQPSTPENLSNKPSIVSENSSIVTPSLERNDVSESPKETDIQHAKDIENVFLTAPNPIEASELIKASPKNPFEKPKTQKMKRPNQSPKKQNNSSVLRSPKKKGLGGWQYLWI